MIFYGIRISWWYARQHIMSKIHAPTKFLEISCSCLKGVVFLLLYLYIYMSSIVISKRPKFKEWYWNKNFLVICTYASHSVHNTYKFLEIPCSDVRVKKRKTKHDWQWFRSCEFFFLKSDNFFKVNPDSLSMKRLKDLLSELMILIHVSSIFL